MQEELTILSQKGAVKVLANSYDPTITPICISVSPLRPPSYGKNGTGM